MTDTENAINEIMGNVREEIANIELTIKKKLDETEREEWFKLLEDLTELANMVERRITWFWKAFETRRISH